MSPLLKLKNELRFWIKDETKMLDNIKSLETMSKRMKKLIDYGLNYNSIQYYAMDQS